MFFVGILFGFLPVRVYALGYGPLTNGILLTAVSASYLLVQPLAGSLADRVSPALTIRAGLFAAGVCVILIPFVTGAALFIVAILAGVGVGTVWTNTDALVSQQAKAGKLGATMGVAGTFKEIGDMLGPLLIGLLSQAFGLTVGFVACGVLGLISLGLITRRQAGRCRGDCISGFPTLAAGAFLSPGGPGLFPTGSAPLPPRRLPHRGPGRVRRPIPTAGFLFKLNSWTETARSVAGSPFVGKKRRNNQTLPAKLPALPDCTCQVKTAGFPGSSGWAIAPGGSALSPASSSLACASTVYPTSGGLSSPGSTRVG